MMKPLFLALCICLAGREDSPASVGTPRVKVVKVTNSSELKNALQLAKPGDSIVLQDGVYSGKFVIPNSSNGLKAKPIILTGGKNAVLDAGNISTGYVLHLKANYWKIKGITIKNGLKGLMLDSASHNVIDGITVTQIGEEGIHLRKFSSHNIIQHSEITHVGLSKPAYGEGIYIGSAHSNWHKYTNGQPDKCDYNKVINNKIGPYVAAECIDIKEGTTGGLIEGNTFDATGIKGENSADSWIDVKGNHYLIVENKGYNTQPSALTDGYQVNCAYAGWGSYNEFKDNICEVNADGYAINVRLKSSKGEAVGNKVYKSNVAIGAKRGISNIAITN